MRRIRLRRLNRAVDAARQAMAVGSLDMDRERDIADWEAIRRAVTVYIPLVALAPVLATLAVYLHG